MYVPLELSFRDGTKDPEVEALIRQEAEKLERFNDHISSCRVAVEKPQENPRRGTGYRVRLDVTVPPGHEIVTSWEPGDGTPDHNLDNIVRDVFGMARRRLKRLNERQQGEEKTHPQQQTVGLVSELAGDHGWLRNPEGHDVYFHRDAVLHGDFDRMAVGTGVNYSEEVGEEGGLRATTVRVVDKPGARPGASQT